MSAIQITHEVILTLQMCAVTCDLGYNDVGLEEGSHAEKASKRLLVALPL